MPEGEPELDALIIHDDGNSEIETGEQSKSKKSSTKKSVTKKVTSSKTTKTKK